MILPQVSVLKTKNYNYTDGKFDIRGTDFKGQTISHEYFSDSILESVNFSLCEIKDVTFKDVNLKKANFRSCYIINCSFDNCDLTNADFIGARIEKTTFKNCEIDSADGLIIA